MKGTKENQIQKPLYTNMGFFFKSIISFFKGQNTDKSVNKKKFQNII